MYNRLKALYLAGKAKEEHLTRAVARGWITEEQKAEILALKPEG